MKGFNEADLPALAAGYRRPWYAPQWEQPSKGNERDALMECVRLDCRIGRRSHGNQRTGQMLFTDSRGATKIPQGCESKAPQRE